MSTKNSKCHLLKAWYVNAILEKMVGHVFGHLTVLRERPRSGNIAARMDCMCFCGKEATFLLSDLARGRKRSCGCLSWKPITHGWNRTPEHNAWVGIKGRCYYPSSPSYKRYGARGIKMCQRWRDSFAAFLTDVGPRPGSDYSIDRVDNDGHYEPGNVRWATIHQQQRNRSSCRMISCFGKELTLVEWSEKTGLGQATISGRLARGMSTEEALTRESVYHRPKHKLKGAMIEWNGEIWDALALAKHNGVTRSALYLRLRYGWSMIEAVTMPPVRKGEDRYGNRTGGAH